MSVLEELWYGNLEPSEYSFSSSREYKELLLFESSFKLGARMMAEMMAE